MILSDYTLKKELAVPLEKYERDKNVSPIIIIENLLKKFLYDEGYIVGNKKKEFIKTPAEIYDERRNNFKIIKKGKTSQLYYKDYYFGYFKNRYVDDVISKLLDFSDSELKELDKKKWDYPQEGYRYFIKEKLNNPLLTIDEFMNEVNLIEYSYKDELYYGLRFAGVEVVRFKKENYNLETVEYVQSFLNELSPKERFAVIKARKKNSHMIGGDFVLKYIEDYPKKKVVNVDEYKRKYVTKRKNGKYSIIKQKHYFGTHTIEKVDEVWEFLNSKKWSGEYSTRSIGLKGADYNIWLYSIMDKAKGKGDAR